MCLHPNVNLVTLLFRYYGMESWSHVWIAKLTEKKSHMHIHYLALESGLEKTDAFGLALSKGLVSFLQFNECTSLTIHRSNPPSFKHELERLVFK